MTGYLAPLASAGTAGAAPRCAFRCLAATDVVPDTEADAYLFDGPAIGAAQLATAAGVIVPRAGGVRATELLAAGARRVLVGEAALRDSAIVAALASSFGGDRVGVYVPACRMEVRWSFDAVSNADFKVLTPSLGAPAWEVLLADGTRTGTQALWWIGEMLALGASEALLRVDLGDDADLNLCADAVERFGERLWIGPLFEEAPRLDEWTRFGGARQLALSPALHARAIADAAVGQGAEGRTEAMTS